jgi:hypothetical protein
MAATHLSHAHYVPDPTILRSIDNTPDNDSRDHSYTAIKVHIAQTEARWLSLT